MYDKEPIPYRGLFSLGLYFRCKAPKLIPLKFLLQYPTKQYPTIQILWRVAPNAKISTHEKLKSENFQL